MLSLTSAAPAAASPEDAVELVERINAERIDDDARPLRMCADLNEVARRWSQKMAEAGESSHNPRREEQVSAWRVLAENVGVGDSAESVHESFMDSEGHSDNVLSPGFTEVGIGVVVHDDRTWVTELFRKPTRSRPCVQPGAGGAAEPLGQSIAHAGVENGAAPAGLTAAVTREARPHRQHKLVARSASA